MPTVAQFGRAALRDYGVDFPASTPRVVVIPSLINPANILDITQERSLLRWLSRHDFHPYLLDWGDVTSADHGLSIADHITECIVPLLKSFRKPVHLIGYCLGGTMAYAAAAITPVASLTMIASPWHFKRYGSQQRAAIAELWASAQGAAEKIGLLPIEALQLMFWQLDAAATVEKYARFADMPLGTPEADLFLAMEIWANSGAPLPFPAARELFEDLIALDKPGREAWAIGRHIITPAHVSCPVLEVVSRTDRIVPSATAMNRGRTLHLDLGHVGMVTGRQAETQLWHPLREWLSLNTKP